MSSLFEKLNTEVKTALKAGDKRRTNVIRMLLSEVKYAQVAGSAKTTLEDNEIWGILNSYQKKLTKSLDDYPIGEKRDEILQEIKIVDEFLPKKASESEIKTTITQILGSIPNPQFGPVMKRLVEHFGTTADGKILSQLLKDQLKN